MKTEIDINITDTAGALEWAKCCLKEKQIPQHDAEHILAMVSGRKRLELLLDNSTLSPKQVQEFQRLINIRVGGYPLQYILGNVSFMGIDLDVNEDVFIPRPETEILVEKAAEKLRRKQQQLLIADIGTGSGNIAIGLTKLIENCKILAVDISEKAIKVAAKNAQKNQVVDRITFFTGELFSPLGEKYQEALDVVISNPPYIVKEQMRSLQEEIKYEPQQALDGGDDGLDFIRVIVNQAYKYLKQNGMIALEIGFGKKEAVEKILTEKRFKDICFFKDYSNIDRIALATKG